MEIHGGWIGKKRGRGKVKIQIEPGGGAQTEQSSLEKGTD